MHWSVLVTVSLCLSVSSFAEKVPGKDSVQEETSPPSNEENEAITESPVPEIVEINSKEDDQIVPQPDIITESSVPESVPGSPILEDIVISNDKDISIASSTIVPVVEPTDVPTTKTGSRILFLAPIVMYSHTLDYLGVAETLASNGHEITMVSAMKFNKPYLHREVLLPMRDINTMLPNLWAG
ncbi:unnamed protein product, partial [Meganyctiphanes norvegica]